MVFDGRWTMSFDTTNLHSYYDITSLRPYIITSLHHYVITTLHSHLPEVMARPERHSLGRKWYLMVDGR